MTETRPPHTDDLPVPEGFVRMTLGDPFEAHLGPFYEKPLTGGEGMFRRLIAFRADARHVNAGGIVHGGMLMTFADAVLGGCAWDANGRKPCVTLSQQNHFLRPARAGDWVACSAEVTRSTPSILFVQGRIDVAGTAIFTASSLWKMMGRS